jgi:hypothetical protein
VCFCLKDNVEVRKDFPTKFAGHHCPAREGEFWGWAPQSVGPKRKHPGTEANNKSFEIVSLAVRMLMIVIWRSDKVKRPAKAVAFAKA